MSLAESFITCHSPSRPLPATVSGLAPANLYSGIPLYVICSTPSAPLTTAKVPGKLSAGPALGVPVTAGQVVAHDPVQVGVPPLVSLL